MKNFINISLVILILSGCSKGKLEPAAYRDWVNNPANGLAIERTVGDFTVTASYRPHEFVVLNEWNPDEEQSDRSFAERMKELEGYQYINLRLDSKDKKTEVLKTALQSQQQYYERLQYLTTLIPRDVYLVDGGDTLPCTLHHYERTYKMTSFSDISLVFENKSKQTNDKILVFDDRLFGLGTLKFHFEKNNLNGVPQLSTYP